VLIKQQLAEQSLVLKKMEIELAEGIAVAAEFLITAFSAGKKLLVMGNGGSAADAQHFAAEIVGRFKMERRGLPAIALTTDTSALTAIANDYGFDRIFSRQVEALANADDVVVGLHGERDLTAQHEGIFAEHRRNAAQPRLPGPCVEGISGQRTRVLLPLFAREIGRWILVLYLRGHVGPDARQRFARLLVAAIGRAPERQPDRLFVVGERRSLGAHKTVDHRANVCGE